MTEAQIAKKLGIAMSSFSLYKLKHSEFSETLKNSKEELIENLEDSLFRRAMGYSYEETKIEKESDGRAKITKTTKELAPDVGALIFALKNLAPGKWTNSDKVEISTSKETSDILKGISEQFAKRTAEVIEGGIDTLDES